MTSAKTQLPYEYYSLPFCQPEGGVAYETLNLGEVLRGDRIVNTAYDVRMDQRIDCKIICEQEITENQAEQIIQRVNENYFVHLLADNLPAVTRWELDNEIVQYEHGYKLGIADEDKIYLHNHLIINLKYNRLDSDGSDEPSYRVVGVDVLPHSIDKISAGVDFECVLPDAD